MPFLGDFRREFETKSSKWSTVYHFVVLEPDAFQDLGPIGAEAQEHQTGSGFFCAKC